MENVQHMTQDNAMEPVNSENPFDQAFDNGG
jgi:hypothetical protein